MPSHRGKAPGWAHVVLPWLLGAGLGPALVALPVNWAADALAGAAHRWFRRMRRNDDLSRLVKAAASTSAGLSRSEFGAVRELLEDKHTWTLLRHGTVADLAAKIAEKLPPGQGRTADDLQAASLGIARGLLEFAVADLEPKLFQKVVMARLERMDTGLTSALDEALLDLNADLLIRFNDVMEQLKRVLERLPPGPAGRGEIAVYLRTLTDWLNSDPWPQDRRFGGPMLTPAAIERKLRVDTGRAGEQDLDADGLAEQCRRLVILGDPGSGKTWLAKRTARRCAEAALQTLAAGGTLDEVELPLYTTCSRLFAADGDIRQAVVSGALYQLGDLGGSRISAALGSFFTERNAPVLLVIDSLDEAYGSDERLRQADTLPWRIVLTSRQSSWNNQMLITEGLGDRLSALQPLRYPNDVEPFIRRWFADDPGRGADLAAQIARRRSLQRAATVPLILAFYCIVGGGQQLPEFRHELYAMVLNRMLTGRWRSSAGGKPDADACVRALRAWAWSAAASHPVSGVGTWQDDIIAESAGLDVAGEDALAHVAAPLGPADIDTGKTVRRFVHRSIREYLVADHIARLPVAEAAELLLPHMWYDADWEYAAPAAVAMHPQHDQLLRMLMCRAANSDHIPQDLSAIDAGGQFRGIIARVASESAEGDWSSEIAAIIGQARVDLARSARFEALSVAASWENSNRQVQETLWAALARQPQGWQAYELVRALVEFTSAPEDKRQAREFLLEALARQSDTHPASSTDQISDIHRAIALADGVAQLEPVADDQRQACEVLLSLLSTLARGRNGSMASQLAEKIMKLTPTTQDKRQVIEALLRILTQHPDNWDAARLADALVELASTVNEKRQVRAALLRQLAGSPNSPATEEILRLVRQQMSQQEMPPELRDELLQQLTTKADRWVAPWLASGVGRLEPTAQDKRQATEALLELLAGQSNGGFAAGAAAELAGGLAWLDPTDEDRRRARGELLRLLALQPDQSYAEMLVKRMIELAPAADDKLQARKALLDLLARIADGTVAAEAASGLAQLDPTTDDKRQAIKALLALLNRKTDGPVAARLANSVAHLDPTADDKRRARAVPLALLATRSGVQAAVELASAIAQLDPTADDKRQARRGLLKMLARTSNGWAAEALASAIAQLNPTADDKRQAYSALLHLLTRHQIDSLAASKMLDRIVELGGADSNLSGYEGWMRSPTVELLAAVRRNSALVNWIAGLPSLASFSSSSAASGPPMLVPVILDEIH